MEFDPKCPDIDTAYSGWGGGEAKCKNSSCQCKKILKTTKEERVRDAAFRGLDLDD